VQVATWSTRAWSTTFSKPGGHMVNEVIEYDLLAPTRRLDEGGIAEMAGICSPTISSKDVFRRL